MNQTVLLYLAVITPLWSIIISLLTLFIEFSKKTEELSHLLSSLAARLAKLGPLDHRKTPLGRA